MVKIHRNTTLRQVQKSNTSQEIQYSTQTRTFEPEEVFRFEDLNRKRSTVDTDYLLAFVYQLIDAKLISELMTVDDRSLLSEYATNTLLLLIIGGLPNGKTIQNNLYDYIYNEITYPSFYQAIKNEDLLLVDGVKNSFVTRKFLETYAHRYAVNETRILNTYLERINKYIDNIKDNQVKLDVKNYLKTIQDDPIVDRTTLLTTFVDGNLKPSTGKRPHFNVNKLLSDTKQHLRDVSDYETKLFTNDMYAMYGLQRPYESKTWIWSHRKKTRHRNMSNTTVPINEPFLVFNDKTGEMCKLRYPRDYANDPVGSNTVNCRCSIEFNKRKPITRRNN